jgi:hypothetical protein
MVTGNMNNAFEIPGLIEAISWQHIPERIEGKLRNLQ